MPQSEVREAQGTGALLDTIANDSTEVKQANAVHVVEAGGCQSWYRGQ